MYKTDFITAASMLILALSLNAEAKLFKWVDDNGVIHYGDVVPPEYANKDKEVVKDNKTGERDKRIESMSPEMIRAKEEEEAKNIASKKEREEKDRRVNALRNTYSSEKEIDLALERNLVLVNARLDRINIQLKSSQSTLDDLKKDADNRSREGRIIPQSLYDDISLTEARITQLQSERAKNEEEMKSLKERFESDKILYRKIMLLKPVKSVENKDAPYPYTDPYTEEAGDYYEYGTVSKRAKKAKSRPRY